MATSMWMQRIRSGEFGCELEQRVEGADLLDAEVFEALSQVGGANRAPGCPPGRRP